MVLDDHTAARPLAEALLAGGISCAEITLRTPAGVEGIRKAAAVPGFTVGAGTVTTAQDVDRVADAGATFVVSPGLDPAVIQRCHDLGLDAYPGIATATEAQSAIRLGLTTVKVFPAALLGGPAFLHALNGPFPELRFIPSGGITRANALDYLRLDSVDTVSGSWMVDRDLLRVGDFDRIRNLAADATALPAS